MKRETLRSATTPDFALFRETRKHFLFSAVPSLCSLTFRTQKRRVKLSRDAGGAIFLYRRRKLAGIILAGGKSVRMGRDKALLPYGSGTLIEHVAKRLGGIATPLVIVADRADKYRVPGVPTIADEYPDCGPVGGIVTGLAAAGQGTHFVVACDMPLFHPYILCYMADLATANYDVVYPIIAERAEPLCAVYRHTALEPLREFLLRGGRAAQQALRELRGRQVDESSLRVFDPLMTSYANWNAPEDLPFPSL